MDLDSLKDERLSWKSVPNEATTSSQRIHNTTFSFLYKCIKNNNSLLLKHGKHIRGSALKSSFTLCKKKTDFH
jgi:hypothetical protein